MDSLLEVQRTCHEERERCVDLMVREYLVEKKTVNLKIFFSKFSKNILFSATRKNKFRPTC